MCEKKKIELLKEHKRSIIELETLHQSAICIPLIETKKENRKEYEVLFEVRSPKIHHQPGDICFPGGMIEEKEKPVDAAMREACEELCIESEQIKLLGGIDLLIGSSIVVYPYVVLLRDYKNTFSMSEVKEVFSVPLQFFLEREPENYEVERPAIPPKDFPYDKIIGGKNYKWRKRFETVYFYQYQDYTIWGMTAKILHSFVDIWRNL